MKLRRERNKMHPRCFSTKVWLLACLLFLVPAQIVVAQKKGSANVLTGFEKSIEQGKINEIERPLLDYARANPGNSRALELLARVRTIQGRTDEAKALYGRALSLDPTSATAKIGAARIAFMLGQKDEAQQLLGSIIQTSSLTASTKMELAAALFLVGKFREALAVIDQLPVDVRNTKALPLTGDIYIETARNQELIDLVPRMKSSSAEDPGLAMQNADVLRRAGLVKDAIVLLRAAVSKKANNAQLFISLARLEIQTRDITQANEHLRRAAGLDPSSAEVLSTQAALENARGNTGAALELMAKARQIAPSSSIVLADYVVLAMRAGKPQEAVDAAKVLLSSDPENPEYEYLLGAASLQNGNIATAQSSLERFMQKRPNDSRGCLALGLTLAAQRDQIDNARRQMNRCLEIDPANFEARYQLGLSYKAQGDNDRAIKYIEDVLKQAPDYAPALRDLGTLYLQAGAGTKARELLERAAAVDPQDADTHFQLSRLYNQSGETALARQHFEIFQKLRSQGGKPVQ